MSFNIKSSVESLYFKLRELERSAAAGTTKATSSTERDGKIIDIIKTLPQIVARINDTSIKDNAILAKKSIESGQLQQAGEYLQKINYQLAKLYPHLSKLKEPEVKEKLAESQVKSAAAASASGAPAAAAAARAAPAAAGGAAAAAAAPLSKKEDLYQALESAYKEKIRNKDDSTVLVEITTALIVNSEKIKQNFKDKKTTQLLTDIEQKIGNDQPLQAQTAFKKLVEHLRNEAFREAHPQVTVAGSSKAENKNLLKDLKVLYGRIELERVDEDGKTYIIHYKPVKHGTPRRIVVEKDSEEDKRLKREKWEELKAHFPDLRKMNDSDEFQTLLSEIEKNIEEDHFDKANQGFQKLLEMIDQIKKPAASASHMQVEDEWGAEGSKASGESVKKSPLEACQEHIEDILKVAQDKAEGQKYKKVTELIDYIVKQIEDKNIKAKIIVTDVMGKKIEITNPDIDNLTHPIAEFVKTLKPEMQKAIIKYASSKSQEVGQSLNDLL